MKNDRIHLILQVTACLFLVFFFIPAGCGLNTAGHMKHSPVVMEQYREKLLPKQFSYFYCGRENLPYAVVGIDPAYTFETKFWFPIEPGPELYRKIDHLSNLESGQNRMYARTIIGPAGNTIGMWFSFYYSTGVIVDDTNYRIQVFNPYKPKVSRSFF
ncbi:hypothetical protein DO021_18230 [Desulfobacter hydrogenophilus]|uniref:Uncharacterized protein n=1 Tax=Desulfobacter hydrogenophilus TaxID=2291 RepID=A0A328F8N9_9BACT|nr:hypothetical protein [Desulfobacter hydrogenophilus]NDY73648.1 hypothetical protein [Desulfobacter hydrogenophilus]QBH14926.1 hypothetical protein EYB58_19595 [Desulfobacter hydrogenophilus]RAM00586.1 hypothetical protein DO021_18230 [Desulfobacter hydrogenophilus]